MSIVVGYVPHWGTGERSLLQTRKAIEGYVSVPANLTAVVSALLYKFCNYASPAGLVACSKPFAIVTVKVFVELNQVLPVWVGLKSLRIGVHRTPALIIAQKNAHEASGKLLGNLPKCQHVS